MYKVRFYPREAGEYAWKVTGVVSAEGKEICEPASAEAKGIVRAVGTHFEYDNGEVFKPFGTTNLRHEPSGGGTAADNVCHLERGAF